MLLIQNPVKGTAWTWRCWEWIHLWLFSAHTEPLSPVLRSHFWQRADALQQIENFRNLVIGLGNVLPFSNSRFPTAISQDCFFSVQLYENVKIAQAVERIQNVYVVEIKFDSDNEIMISEHQILKKDGFKLSQFGQVKLLQTPTANPLIPHSSKLKSSKTLQRKLPTFLLIFVTLALNWLFYLGATYLIL